MRRNLSITKIRKQSLIAETSGKFPAEWLNQIYKERFFKIFVPVESGGRMLSLSEALRLFDNMAEIDGNLGWAVTIGSGGGYFYGYIETGIAKKVFDNPKAVIAGSGSPMAIAKKVKGGYRVSGKWKYCSGAPYATSFTANATIQGDKMGIKSLIFEPAQVKIHKDWDAFGMRATESHSISVKDVFVPHEMTFDMSASKPFYKHPLYTYPFLQFAETSFASLCFGLCRHFMKEANQLVENNKADWQSVRGRYNFVKEVIAENENHLNESSNIFYEVVDKSYDAMVRSGKLSQQLQYDVSKVSKRTSRIILACVDNILPCLGMGAIMQHSSINTIWRNIHTVCQHILLIDFAI